MDLEGTAYKFAPLFEYVCHGLLTRNILSDLPETRHEVKQLLQDYDNLAIVA